MKTPTVTELTRRAFDENGPIAKLPGFKVTRPQREYAMTVAETLDAGRHEGASGTKIRMIEGEPGIGKTIGYLVPTLLHAGMTGKRCGISVHTLDLQNQLWGERALLENRTPDWKQGDDSDLAVAL